MQLERCRTTTPPNLIFDPYRTTVPSDQPSDTPSMVKIRVTTPDSWIQPSNLPSDYPSLVPFVWVEPPTIAPTGRPSAVPSDAPSLVPSGIPTEEFTVPTQAPSRVPSDGPSQSRSYVSSGVPNDQPSMAPSVVPSDQPSVTPSDAPSLEPTSIASDMPSFVPTVVPSDSPSLIPSSLISGSRSDVPSIVPSDSPSKLPSTKPSESWVLPDSVIGSTEDLETSNPTASYTDLASDFPSVTTSNFPSDRPSTEPSDIPSDLSSVFPSSSPTTESSVPLSDSSSSVPNFSRSAYPSDLPSGWPSSIGAPDFVYVDTVTLESELKEPMDDSTTQVFESVCAEEFLPVYLPKIHQAEYSDIQCHVLSQRELHVRHRTLQETGNVELQTGSVAILLRASSQVDRAPERFVEVVRAAFEIYSTEFQQLLSDQTDYFEPVWTGGSNTDPSAAVAPVSNDTSDKKQLVIIVGSVMGGLVLAIALFIFLKVREVDNIRSYDNHVEVFSIGSQDGSLAKASIATGPRPRPPSPIEIPEPVPSEIDPWASEEERQMRVVALTPNSVDSYLVLDDDEEEGGLPVSDPLGLRQSASSVEKNLQRKDRLKMIATISTGGDSDGDESPRRKSKANFSIITDGNSEESDLFTDKEDTSGSGSGTNGATDSSSDLKGLRLVDSSGTFSIKYEQKTPDKTFRPWQLFGFQRKSNGPGDSISDFYPSSSSLSESVSISIDPTQPAGTPVHKQMPKLLDMGPEIDPDLSSSSSHNEFIREGKTESGAKYLQINTDSASHTGSVLDDLSSLESQRHRRLKSRPTPSDPTPKVDNRGKYHKAPRNVLHRYEYGL